MAETSRSTFGLPAPGPDEKHFRFLDLPAEIRNQIYSYLYSWRGDPSCEGAIVPQFVHADPNGHSDCKGDFDRLVALMRTNRQLYAETVTLLYAPMFKFEHSRVLGCRPWNLNFLRDGGPARHLRQVYVHLGRTRTTRERWPPTSYADDDYSSVRGSMPYPESILWALARNARQLERLDLAIPYRRWFGEGGIHGLPIMPDCSWMDPVLQLPADPEKQGPPPPTEKQLLAILAFLAPGDEALQLRIRQKIEESQGHRKLSSDNFWTVVWIRLWHLGAQKIFWGREIIEILKSFSPTLRVIGLVGWVDKKWMKTVADMMDVKVRAKVPLWDEEWVTVDPRRLDSPRW